MLEKFKSAAYGRKGVKYSNKKGKEVRPTQSIDWSHTIDQDATQLSKFMDFLSSPNWVKRHPLELTTLLVLYQDFCCFGWEIE